MNAGYASCFVITIFALEKTDVGLRTGVSFSSLHVEFGLGSWMGATTSAESSSTLNMLSATCSAEKYVLAIVYIL